MKKVFALLFAILSGIYLVVGGPLPDPIPFVDEGMAFLIFINSLAALGLDLRRFVGMGGKKKDDELKSAKGKVVDS